MQDSEKQSKNIIGTRLKKDKEDKEMNYKIRTTKIRVADEFSIEMIYQFEEMIGSWEDQRIELLEASQDAHRRVELEYRYGMSYGDDARQGAKPNLGLGNEDSNDVNKITEPVIGKNHRNSDNACGKAELNMKIRMFERSNVTTELEHGTDDDVSGLVTNGDSRVRGNKS